MRLLQLVTAAVALLLGSACAAFGESPPSDPGEPVVADSTTPTPTPAPTATPTTSNTSPTSPVPADPAACKAGATRQACIVCCTNQSTNDRAELVAIDKAWVTCACAPSRCQEACATECSTERRSGTSPACGECLVEKGEADRRRTRRPAFLLNIFLISWLLNL